MTDEDRAAIDDLMLELTRDGKPFLAAKEYRSLSGHGLVEASQHIARLARQHGLGVPSALDL